MTTNDLFLVMGLVIAVLAVPAIFSALASGDPPRVPAVAVVVGGGLMMYAIYNQPGGYSIEEIPAAFGRVVRAFIN